MKNISDNLSDIKNLKYTIEDNIINITYFETKYKESEKFNKTHDLKNGEKLIKRGKPMLFL